MKDNLLLGNGNSLIFRLLKCIEYEYIKYFTIKQMKENKFIVVTCKDKYLYTIVTENTNNDLVNTLITNKLDFQPKFITIPCYQFDRILKCLEDIFES